MRRVDRLALGFVMVAGGLAVGAAALVLAGATALAVGTVVAGAMAAVGSATIRVVHQATDSEADEEVRSVKGPGVHRRVLLAWGGVGTAALGAGVLAVPAARRLDQATQALQQTPWRDGLRVVDDSGQIVRLDSVAEGEGVTVWPEGHVGVNDAQALLLREPPERLRPVAGREDWAPDGFVAYSKLCTHMGCPVGLYQQLEGTLLCPCHQAVFNALDGGTVVRGPARRPLPQLPLAVDDGELLATGDFSAAVGTGFWHRP